MPKSELKPADLNTDTADLVSEAAIRDRAYHLWDAAGRPEGDADRFWYEAHHQATAELIARSIEGTVRALDGKIIHADLPKPIKPPRATKPKKVEAEKPAKKATKPRAAGVPTAH